MENSNKHSDDLKVIRKIMEESSRFLSLSGLSGVIIGILALVGAIFALLIIQKFHPGSGLLIYPESIKSEAAIFLAIDAVLVLTAAICIAYFFALKNSRKNNIPLRGPVTRRLLFSLSVPLIFGALFIIVLLVNNNPEYLVSTMLCFYGMALINAGKFTFDEVHYLGISELILGIAAGFFPEYGLIFWVLGFSLLHILYGAILHQKYN
jgi:hypothetical protein